MERADLARLLGCAPRAEEAAVRPTVVAEQNPGRFIAAFTAAVAGGGPVFLADPAWGAAERAALAALIDRPPPAAAPAAPASDRGWLMVPSGGTGGRLKFARHDEGTLAAAVRGFCAHAGVSRVNCVSVLPLHHVSGLMAWMRTVWTGGTYLPWDWKRLEAGVRPGAPAGEKDWFLSLVPTQLQRLLGAEEAIEWLRGFAAIFVGGGPLWPELAEASAQARLPLAPSYGMTETAAMVAALPPAEFLAGARSSGRALPHARLDLSPEGTVRIAGDAVFRGYYPEWRESREFTTDDLGRFDERGQLHILGRRDELIITGGEKVDPREVEETLRAGGLFADVAVIGLPDREWGQAVVACYPEGSPAPDLTRVGAALERLAPFKRPRRFIAIPAWPRNAQGKLNRAELLRKASNG